MATTIERLARFAVETDYDALPDYVSTEAKRLVLDSIGCALVADDSPKGRIGIEYGLRIGAGREEATIIGTAHRVSRFGAAFANAELINALDFDAVLPPGHVVPFVLPGVLAVAEGSHLTGRDVISSVAVGHEMTYRIGRSMDYVRDVRDGFVSHPAVFGYSASVFGATAAIAHLLKSSYHVHANALGVAAYIAPVNSMWSAVQRSHATTIKFTHAGTLTQTAFTAAYMAEGGHFGDPDVLDDRDYGFPRFIGTSTWTPERITERLGEQWQFPAQQTYKLYAHCRVPAALIDELEALVEQYDLHPSEIESIQAWGEPQGTLPVWANREINNLNDAQSSIAHALSVGAHRIRPRYRWQAPEVVFDPSVLSLMKRVTFRAHPRYAELVLADPASRPARIEVRARGEVFERERRYPRGGSSPDLSSFLSTEELVSKFRENAQGRLSDVATDRILEQVLDMESVSDFADLMQAAAKPSETFGVPSV